MTIEEKYTETYDRYYHSRYGISKKQYDKAFTWACKKWYNMLLKAQGKNAVSIANQIAQACRVPYSAGRDIANSISLSQGI